MASKKQGPDSDGVNRLVAEVLARRKDAEKGYRERALKLFPPICAHCGREFSGKRLRELTVHHKDSDHHNNPPDGSNWELLCLYCHDEEHQDTQMSGYHKRSVAHSDEDASSDYRPFEGLGGLLKPEGEEPAKEE